MLEDRARDTVGERFDQRVRLGRNDLGDLAHDLFVIEGRGEIVGCGRGAGVEARGDAHDERLVLRPFVGGDSDAAAKLQASHFDEI